MRYLVVVAMLAAVGCSGRPIDEAISCSFSSNMLNLSTSDGQSCIAKSSTSTVEFTLSTPDNLQLIDVSASAVNQRSTLGDADNWLLLHNFKGANFECDSWTGTVTVSGNASDMTLTIDAACNAMTLSASAEIIR